MTATTARLGEGEADLLNDTKAVWKSAPEFLNGLLDTLTQRGRTMLGKRTARLQSDARNLISLGEALLSRQGEASGVALAQSLFSLFDRSDEAERLRFLSSLADRFGPDRRLVDSAIASYHQGIKDGNGKAIDGIHAAAEPRRQELFRRLNLASQGTSGLIRIREALLPLLPLHPELKPVDNDFVHLFSSWFNRGFLVLKPIDWTTPANILEKIIKYEAVHEIRDWQDLRNRLEPTDRRCYAFFHPQLIDEPLIFVEVALTKDIPDAISPLLDGSRHTIEASEANTAVFYSISNTQKGLAGVSFGNFLIKQVVQDLARELPALKTFVTLSPVPGFANWARREFKREQSQALDDEARRAIEAAENGADLTSIREPLMALAAYYFLKAKQSSGKPADPVARFHLGNGARLERLNYLGDTSPKGRSQSFGLMVNYLYVLDHIERNHEAFAEHGTVVASDSVKKALRGNLTSRELTLAGTEIN